MEEEVLDVVRERSGPGGLLVGPPENVGNVPVRTVADPTGDPAKSSGQAFFDRLIDDPFRLKVVKVGPVPVPVAVPGPGWLTLGAIVVLYDAVRPGPLNWNPITPFAVTVSVTLTGAQQPFTVSVPVPLVVSQYIFSGASAGEIYLKLTIAGIIWPIILLIDLIIPIIAGVVAIITVAATTPAVLMNALANFLSDLIRNIFTMVMNFVMSLLCMLFGKADSVCNDCGCQRF